MKFKDRISIEEKAGSVALRFELLKGHLKTAFFPPVRTDFMFRTMIVKKIKALVSQRKYQVEHQLAPFTDDQQKALKNALAKLDYAPNWNRSNWHRSIEAILPNLRTMAPESGKFVESWHSLIDALECISAENDIVPQINNLVYG